MVDGPNILVSSRPTAISKDLPEILAGSTPIDWGFLTVEADELDVVRSDPIAAKYLRTYLGGRELINGIQRWCLWMDTPEFDPIDIRRSQVLADRVAAVARHRAESKRGATKALAATPHLFGERRQPSVDYLAIPQTFTENRLFATAARLDASVIASIKLFTAPDPDGYLFAVVSSSMFIVWQKTIGGRLKSDPSFSNDLVWKNFPLPLMSPDERACIVACGEQVISTRQNYPSLTLADLYDPSRTPAELTEAHRRLDDAVDSVFRCESGLSETERQEVLFRQYAAMTAG